jgi:hypothetical protein
MAAVSKGTGWYNTTALTGSAPSASTEGLSLNCVDGFCVVVEAPSGQTLSGAGTLQAYIWDPLLNAGAGAWARMPAGDKSVTGTAARQAFAADEVLSGRGGRVIYIPSSVTVSSGTTCTVYILGFSKSLNKSGGYT